jgi:hypothetical protein
MGHFTLLKKKNQGPLGKALRPLCLWRDPNRQRGARGQLIHRLRVPATRVGGGVGFCPLQT